MTALATSREETMYAKLRMHQKFLIQGVLLLLALLWLAPLSIAVVKSLNVKGLENYVTVLNNPQVNVLRVVLNSFFVAIVTAAILTVVVSLAAFAFSKMQFAFKDSLYYALLVTLTIPLASVISPLFFTVKRIGLMNSYFSLILPMAAFQAPFLLLILKNYFDTIPNDLIEAARIDGGSGLHVLYNVMIPLGKPALVNILVLSFISSWNEYFIPLLFVRNRAMYTVTLATTFFTGSKFQTPEMVAQLYATLILMTIPSIIIYLFAQRYMQEGLTAGAVKS
jgi:raffinose/stachyose/melibiose transport system permease protein